MPPAKERTSGLFASARSSRIAEPLRRFILLENLIICFIPPVYYKAFYMII